MSVMQNEPDPTTPAPEPSEAYYGQGEPSPTPPSDVPTLSEVAEETDGPEISDVDRLLQEPIGPVTLASGTQVIIRPLKLREFLRLLRILTRGGAALMADVSLDMEDTEKFVQSLLAMLFFSIPEAEDEAVDFVASVVDPANLTGRPKEDEYARRLLAEELENPELEDVLEIFTMLIRKEGKDLQALGKRLRTMFQTARKMGAV